MRTRNKFWWFVAMALCVTAVTFIVLGVFFWQDLTAAEKRQLIGLVAGHPTFFFMAFILVIAAIGFALDGVLNSYILPLNRMVEGLRIILSANPSHRLAVDGSRTGQQLSELVNQLADHVETINDKVAARMATARESCEREKNILAAMVAELPNGVVICNMDHRVILYNRRARDLLETSGDPIAEGRHYLGLGRRITTVVDGALVRFGMEDVIRKVARQDAGVTTQFVIPGKDGRLVQSEMVPVLDGRHEFNAYILILKDVTARMESRYRLSRLMSHLITRARASLAGIRSAGESLVAFPDMDERRKRRLMGIIREEAIALSDILDASAAELPASSRSAWPLIPVRLDDLFRTLLRQHGGPAGIRIAVHTESEALWIRADGYLLLTALGGIIDKIAEDETVSAIDVGGDLDGGFVHVDMTWHGRAVSRDGIDAWMAAPLHRGSARLPLSLAQVIERHDGELILRRPAEKGDERSGLRLLLPALSAEGLAEHQSPAVISASRPAFYDFDLFHQAGQLPELDDQSLSMLSYTVFDTETTGLNPRGGDEIISIGAVRIVNQQLLLEESFDQLVDPCRPIPWESIKYHGIHQDMVEGQPTVGEALARFHRYCADTVLVGHNVAFDMRMLQMKEEKTGIYFINPVLDTMLLSAVVHPTHDDHSLEGIAGRLGVSIEGRHTALGDATATAKVFTKLIPLLGQIGIRSLGETRQASQKTYFARMNY